MEIDDKTLTLFLMDCMQQVFERSQKATDKHMIPGTVQRGLKHHGFTYLEVITGTIAASSIDIIIYRDGRTTPIFKMNINAKMYTDALQQNDLVYTDAHHVLVAARIEGFMRTRAKISAGEKKFSLFEIPRLEQIAFKNNQQRIGRYIYEESVDDTLDFFGGVEEIYFQKDGYNKTKVLIYRSQIQGLRFA